MKNSLLRNLRIGLFAAVALAASGRLATAQPLTCNGTGDGTWNGCRGTGCHVCQEKVASYDCYFVNHPNCVLNTTCGGQFYDCDAACPPPTEADYCSAGDSDGDGLGDALEDQLLWRFAPVVRLHPSDSYRPSSGDWYLARTQMRFDHSGCSDDQILNKGQITPWNIDLQSHQNKSGWPSCQPTTVPCSTPT